CTAISLGAVMPMRTWLPFTPNTVTVTWSPIIRVSPTRRVKINMTELHSLGSIGPENHDARSPPDRESRQDRTIANQRRCIATFRFLHHPHKTGAGAIKASRLYMNAP